MICKQVISSSSPTGGDACGCKKASGQKGNRKMSGEEDERTRIFGGLDPGGKDPRIPLLDMVFAELSRAKQIDYVKRALAWARLWVQDEEAICLVEALERVFGEDSMAFRTQLRGIYSDLFSPDYVDIRDVFPKLRLAILSKILQGWSKRILHPLFGLPEDTEACFKFVCEAYERAGEKIQKEILDLFREPFNGLGEDDYSSSPKIALRLHPWIREAPQDIASVLLKGRTRVVGVSAGKKEIEFLGALNIHNCLDRTVIMAREYIEMLKRTEESASKLAETSGI